MHDPAVSVALALVGNGVHLLVDGILVTEVPLGNDVEIGVELVDQRDARGDVDTDDLLIGKSLEDLDECAEGVSMGGDDDPLTCDHPGLDLLLEVGDGTLHGLLQTLGKGQEMLRDAPVLLVERRVPGIVGVE